LARAVSVVILSGTLVDAMLERRKSFSGSDYEVEMASSRSEQRKCLWALVLLLSGFACDQPYDPVETRKESKEEERESQAYLTKLREEKSPLEEPAQPVETSNPPLDAIRTAEKDSEEIVRKCAKRVLQRRSRR